MAYTEKDSTLPNTRIEITTPSQTQPPPTLTTLPLELLLLIHSHLHPAAKLALSLTTRRLYLDLPTLAAAKSTVHATNLLALTPCGRKAISTHLSFTKKRKNRRYCRYCSQWYPTALFANPWLPLSSETEEESKEKQKYLSNRLLENGVDEMGGPGMLTLPPEICGWHRGNFVHLVSGPPCTNNTITTTITTTSSPGTSSSSAPLSTPRHKYQGNLYPIQTTLPPGWWEIPSLLCLHCKKTTTNSFHFNTQTSSKSTQNPNSTQTSTPNSTPNSTQISHPKKQETPKESPTHHYERTAKWDKCPNCPRCPDCTLLPLDIYKRIPIPLSSNSKGNPISQPKPKKKTNTNTDKKTSKIDTNYTKAEVFNNDDISEGDGLTNNDNNTNNEASISTSISTSPSTSEATKISNIPPQNPARFVIYRQDGEIWVREWETSKSLPFLLTVQFNSIQVNLFHSSSSTIHLEFVNVVV